MGLIETIKKAGLDAYGASNPVHIVFGEIRNTDPLVVNVDQRFDLTADFLIVPESLQHFEINLQHSHNYSEGTTDTALNESVVVRRGLEIGDKVILLRMQGGQKYVVLDRTVNT